MGRCKSPRVYRAHRDDIYNRPQHWGDATLTDIVKKQLGPALHRNCRTCQECRWMQTREAALRCVLEASLHDENAFITLTYDKEHLPADNSLSRTDWQLFMKKLRKHFEPKTLRYYMAGEYGEQNGRPHYHALLFGVNFDDKDFLKRGAHGFPVYTSETLSRIWGKGIVAIGEVETMSARYVTGYIRKKIIGDQAADVYAEKTPPFCLVSRGQTNDTDGGIGYRWYAENNQCLFSA